MQHSYMCNHAPGHTGLLTAQHTRGVLCSHLARRQVLARTADLTTSPLPPAKQPAPSIYQPKVVQLPYLNKNYIKPSADLPEDVFNAPRQASALVYDPAIVGETVPAIICGHGFSQGPDNYASTLELLRQQGWLVIAPKTDLLDTLWRQIEGAGAKAKMPGQLQTALILDMLRSLQFLREDPAYKGRIGKVAFFGHSMGAAGAIVAASKVKEEDAMGVTVLAPAANSMEHTLINDGIWLNGSPASIEATLNFFKKEFPESCPLTLVRGSGDLIVPPPVVARLFSIGKEARKDEDVWLVTVDGNHTGFEDQLLLPTTVSLEGANIPFPISLIGASNLDRLIGGLLWALNGTVIKLVEFLEYKTYVLSFLINNSPKQKEEMRATITTSFKQIFTGEGFDLKEGSYEVELMSSIVPGKAPTVEEMFKRAELNMDFDATTTGLLVAYALAQAVNTVSAGKLLLQSIAAGGLDETTLGLAIITALSAGLIYDNTLLAAGRFIGEGRLLEDLSEFRFLGHSGAPLALIAGLNIAGRVGVAWATDPSLEGAVGLVILFFVGISSIRNGLLLELQSKWEKGTLRYTYSDKNPDVTRVIPVIVSTVGLAVTGVVAAVTDHSYWPLAAAPLAALALNALPSSNKGDSELGEQPPPFVAGNFAEVLLFGALVWAEAALLAAGK